MKLNNNVVAILTIIFMFSSIYSNWLIYEKSKAVGYITKAEVGFCLNRPPEINASCALNASVGVLYVCDINVTDDETEFLFTTNASPDLFVIASSTGLISFTPTTDDVGNYTINATVNDLIGCGNSNDSALFNLSISRVLNNPPVLATPIPDQSWNEDTTLTGLDLDDYFSDPDGDTLAYTVTGNVRISISINSLGIVTFVPEANWYGEEYVVFNASDGEFSVESNTVKLTVINVPEVVTVIPTPGGGGGGAVGKRFICEPEWSCTIWSDCYPNGTRHRTCVDLIECRTTKGKPAEVEACVYIPHCHNGIQDPNEEGIDCGGPCKPCPSCYDGIQNQGETGIDCGGPCKPCPSCYDGIQNQGETRIDCGGPCKPCLPPIIEKPLRIFKEQKPLLLIVLLILLVLLLLLFRSLLKKKKKLKKGEKRIVRRKRRFKVKEAKIKKGVFKKEKPEIEKIEQLKQKIKKEEVEPLFDEFSSFMRGFYRRLFKIEHEFSHKDLEGSINKARIKEESKKQLISLYNKIEHLKYSHHEPTKKELSSLLDKAKKIVESSK